MPIFLPRNILISFSPSADSSVPSKYTRPDRNAFCGRRSGIALTVTDLPLPDSPTMPSTSPLCIENETPRTAKTSMRFPSRKTVKVTERFSTERKLRAAGYTLCTSGADTEEIESFLG